MLWRRIHAGVVRSRTLPCKILRHIEIRDDFGRLSLSQWCTYATFLRTTVARARYLSLRNCERAHCVDSDRARSFPAPPVTCSSHWRRYAGGTEFALLVGKPPRSVGYSLQHLGGSGLAPR